MRSWRRRQRGKGDVRFFELAYLEASIEPTKTAREFQVSLENFVIPNPELVPDDVREKITKWSDYVDYWAVDWDFRDDTFMQGWVTYRTQARSDARARLGPAHLRRAGRIPGDDQGHRRLRERHVEARHVTVD